ncbi:hypothetical protein N7468_002386 [Penicillium chermesinum]|uniref:Uncharacterized protein n=1 Tax=Penicillium chermesinum TaxID=63820 RepID=A0A9W9TYD5_9EURO|nr:uncharacterized protein N7468_002386 [Penicillium chermesinum]KAJ5247403.1 hypothetical protein N7468_002386 [Penicillium chermesinum]
MAVSPNCPPSLIEETPPAIPEAVQSRVSMIINQELESPCKQSLATRHTWSIHPSSTYSMKLESARMWLALTQVAPAALIRTTVN